VAKHTCNDPPIIAPALYDTFGSKEVLANSWRPRRLIPASRPVPPSLLCPCHIRCRPVCVDGDGLAAVQVEHDVARFVWKIVQASSVIARDPALGEGPNQSESESESE
jgi:hypothetical protein